MKTGVRHIFLALFLCAACAHVPPPLPAPEGDPNLPSSVSWQPPPAALALIEQIADPAERQLVRYGKELFLHTAYYLGPKGVVARHGGNSMNCQNCHLDGGLRKYGNDLTHAKERYPMYRPREGRILTLAERINNCVERPLNGKPLPMEGREMKAIHAYLSWLSTTPLYAETKAGENLTTITYPKRAADPKRGEKIFEANCARCHGADGNGQMHSDGIAFLYPALWGSQSFNAGSSMSLVTKMARFVKANMPLGTTWDQPLLSDEEALDVAAFVLDPKSHPRPVKFDPRQEYPKREEKPIDFAIGPYVDAFTEEQHRLGPYGPIEEFYKQLKLAKQK